MRKILTLTLLMLLTMGGYAGARTVYDSTGRHIIYDDSIRGHKRAAQSTQIQKPIQAAAAAKLNYEDADNAVVKQHKKFAAPTTKTVTTTLQSSYSKEE